MAVLDFHQGEDRLLAFVLTVLWLGVAGTALISGMEYYLLPLNDRAYSDLAAMFSPTGLVGQGFGVIGSAMIIIGVSGYTARKRFRFLGRLGALKYWLEVHIFLCTLGPFLVLLHTTFKFGGIVSIAFWSMTIVVASGVFGRYVYVRIPKTINGSFLTMNAVSDKVAELTRSMAEQTGIAETEFEGLLSPALAVGDRRTLPRPSGLASALASALRDDLRQRRELRELRKFLRGRSVPSTLVGPVLSLAEERRRLRHQAAMLQPFQRLFRYWHVVHLPLAIVMFVILGLHVGVAILFGYTWIF